MLKSALITAVALTLSGAASAQPTASTVVIDHHMFTPGTISVPVGATVIWTNRDGAPHTVTSDDGGFKSSGWIWRGGRYSVTFPSAGRFSYHCNIHHGMTGAVVVG